MKLDGIETLEISLRKEKDYENHVSRWNFFKFYSGIIAVVRKFSHITEF